MNVLDTPIPYLASNAFFGGMYGETGLRVGL